MKFNVMSRLKKEKTLVCSNKKERKLLITSVSWARSAMSNTYIHEPFQKTNYKIGEILLVALENHALNLPPKVFPSSSKFSMSFSFRLSSLIEATV